MCLVHSTDYPDFVSSAFARPKTASYPPLNASDAVFDAISLLDIHQPERILKTFTDFRTRCKSVQFVVWRNADSEGKTTAAR